MAHPHDFPDDLLELIASRFRCLGEPMRLRLLQALRTGERSVTELVELTGAGQANVSRHLATLSRHGLVARRRDGLSVFYRIADPRVFDLCELVCDGLTEATEAQSATLRSATGRTERPSERARPA